MSLIVSIVSCKLKTYCKDTQSSQKINISLFFLHILGFLAVQTSFYVLLTAGWLLKYSKLKFFALARAGREATKQNVPARPRVYC